jgi:hypothetical protein
LADNRQKRKPILSANGTFLTVDRPILSFPIHRIQTLGPFLFLILKRHRNSSDAKRVPNTQAKASVNFVTFQEPIPRPELVDN